MKKIALLVFVALASLEICAWAATPGTPEYDRLKEFKKVQRQQREAAAKDPAKAEKSFWQKEAERSGFAGTGAMFGNAIGGVLPKGKKDAK